MTEKSMITIRRVSKAFGRGEASVRALDDVSLEIAQGEFFTLLGPSGCGKTTLLRMIAGFEMPTEGEIFLDGAAISHLPPNRRPVNTVFQSYALFPHLTVAENIAFGLKMLGRSRAEQRQRTERMLSLVRLDSLAGRRTSQLSGGQQQRVALARALAPEPKVLLLDEPLSALDLQLRKEMQVELKRLQTETGITFVFVTHDQEEALTMSDRIGVMSAGRLQQTGTPREVYTRPANRFVAAFIGETNLLRGIATGEGVRLPGGFLLPVEEPARGEVTLTIRPEHIRIVAPEEQGAIPAEVRSAIYFGTDTHYHLALADETPLIARAQSAVDGMSALQPGQQVGLRVAPGAAHVLGD
ncbi:MULTISPECIES: ABC transporter ATP-binding protein [unclassified Haematobacter]|uniref:ABC transporter ATP-binding protein n=1 Tax=unclassified Haematobacter TaxID=2640585 RepID=UPI0039184C80